MSISSEDEEESDHEHDRRLSNGSNHRASPRKRKRSQVVMSAFEHTAHALAKIDPSHPAFSYLSNALTLQKPGAGKHSLYLMAKGKKKLLATFQTAEDLELFVQEHDFQPQIESGKMVVHVCN